MKYNIVWINKDPTEPIRFATKKDFQKFTYNDLYTIRGILYDLTGKNHKRNKGKKHRNPKH